MRILLTQESLKALESLQSQIKRENQFVETYPSQFINQLIVTLGRELNRDQIAQIAPHLTSARIKRKLVRERLVKLADQIDEGVLKKLERRIVKAEKQTNSSINIEEEITKKCCESR